MGGSASTSCPAERSRRSALRLLGLGVGLGLSAAAGCGPSCSCEAVPEPEGVTVYIVRHAEKELPSHPPPEPGPGPGNMDDDDVEGARMRKDPPLSAAGQRRAMALAEDLPIRELDAIYVTRSRRSEQTAAAVLALTGLEATHYPPKDYAGIAKRLRARPGWEILLVGHSNTIPPLLEALGAKQRIRIGEAQYGDMWVVHAKPDGSATVERRRFGDAIDRYSPPPAEAEAAVSQ